MTNRFPTSLRDAFDMRTKSWDSFVDSRMRNDPIDGLEAVARYFGIPPARIASVRRGTRRIDGMDTRTDRFRCPDAAVATALFGCVPGIMPDDRDPRMWSMPLDRAVTDRWRDRLTDALDVLVVHDSAQRAWMHAFSPKRDDMASSEFKGILRRPPVQ